MHPKRVTVERHRISENGLQRMGQEVREALAAEPPSLPCKYFYDDHGSQLFEAITRLPEYYQTRTEEQLLAVVADDVVSYAQPRELVELGSGAGRKIRLLLDGMARQMRLERCTLLDINESFLVASARRLADQYEGLEVRGIVADFTRDLDLLEPAAERLIAFLGGTIGNLMPDVVPDLLTEIRAVLRDDGSVLVGLDLVKDQDRLEDAYNDQAGVTAEFNLNILRVINRRLGADFDLDAFEHVAFYDPDQEWIEMRVRATRPMEVTIPGAELTMELEPGDEVRTEISCKFTRDSLTDLVADTGLALRRWFTDPEDLFALALLQPE